MLQKRTEVKLPVPLAANTAVCQDICKLSFAWEGESPQAGQFFMIKPARTPVFLGRPISVFAVNPLTFIVARKGAGTDALCAMSPGDEAELIGPLGNRFADFLPPKTDRLAVVGGGIGAAPVYAFARELRQKNINHAAFAGFKSAETAIPQDGDCPAHRENAPVIITEDGSLGRKGFVTDFLVPSHYDAVFACGPLPMLHAVGQKCAANGTPCFVSMEKRMACGVGACLGCRIETKQGNRRCCKDGPVFDAKEIVW
jgi:NAD(P)H-flavin reductase